MRQLENIDSFVILDPQPERLDLSVNLTTPVERTLNFYRDLQDVRTEWPEAVGYLDGGELLCRIPYCRTMLLIEMDELAQILGAHLSKLRNSILVRPSF